MKNSIPGAQLIDILRCPETMQSVRLATAEELANCNSSIDARAVFTRAGKLRIEPLKNGLLREDGRQLFPIENGIPVMLIEEALVLP